MTTTTPPNPRLEPCPNASSANNTHAIFATLAQPSDRARTAGMSPRGERGGFSLRRASGRPRTTPRLVSGQADSLFPRRAAVRIGDRVARQARDRTELVGRLWELVAWFDLYGNGSSALRAAPANK
jgi:hypothetical protein